MIMRAINRIEKDTGPRMKIFSPIFDNRGKVRASIAGIIVFLLGIGLTLFVIANPMDVGLFEKVKRLVLPSVAKTGGPSAGGDRSKRLGAVDHAAAAEGDDEVRSEVTTLGGSTIHVVGGGAGRDADRPRDVDPCTS